ncbi:MAG TPA: Crp/Fnr family transcriptional regulator [Candidatus Saccharimonadales bacterium]|nr:Crp/Fnr family transcriptional regulator [Candidatus Saccharimonadales bacterium]
MKRAENSFPSLLQGALQKARVRHVPGGQIILYADDIPKEVFILKSGIVKLYDIDDQGNEKLLHLVKAPAVVPFAFFSGTEVPLKWFYTTLTDCDMYVLGIDELHTMMHTDAALAELLMNRFSADVHELLVRLSSLGKTNARDKVLAALRFLLTVHAIERRSGWWRVTFPVSHQLIGDLCGITRETTAIAMKELQNETIVRNPRVTILEINKKNLLGI